MEKFLSDLYQVTIYKSRWKMYVEGLVNTVTISLLACLIGICIGLVISLVKVASLGKKTAGWTLLRGVCSLYTTIIRGTPVIVQLLILYTLAVDGEYTACVLGFGINSGAYVSEIIRSGILSIDKGQMEAGRSLGLSQWKTMRLIILPQAIKNILPALFNEFIALLKETSIAGYIAVRDLTKVSDSLRGITFIGTPLFIAAGIYLVLVVGLTELQKHMERRLARSDRN